jgi:hypothetical protein
LAILSQEPIWLPIKRVSYVYAKVLVGEYFFTATDNKPLERPVALTNTKFTTPRVIEVA